QREGPRRAGFPEGDGARQRQHHVPDPRRVPGLRDAGRDVRRLARSLGRVRGAAGLLALCEPRSMPYAPVTSRLPLVVSAVIATLVAPGCQTTTSTTPSTTEQFRPGIANATALENLP